ncbi:MAG: ThuA domain-containing protein [Armatimonadetes bacterium]|nr:ThuA domain-containing protein [Armatimonadota bacterium]
MLAAAFIAIAFAPKPAILVFSKTAGYRHESIPDGIAAIQKLGKQNNFAVEATEDSSQINQSNLKNYRAVVFLSTTGDILDLTQQTDFRSYVESGGGFVGIHAAADTEYDWPWYGRLVGAWFKSHPAIQPAAVKILDAGHPSTAHLPKTWARTDEWYDYRALPETQILAKLDPASYQGHTMGDDHPIVWCHMVGKGRSWYTGMGHTKESYADPMFQKHLLGGILWATGIKE